MESVGVRFRHEPAVAGVAGYFLDAKHDVLLSLCDVRRYAGSFGSIVLMVPSLMVRSFPALNSATGSARSRGRRENRPFQRLGDERANSRERNWRSNPATSALRSIPSVGCSVRAAISSPQNLITSPRRSPALRLLFASRAVPRFEILALERLRNATANPSTPSSPVLREKETPAPEEAQSPPGAVFFSSMD